MSNQFVKTMNKNLKAEYIILGGTNSVELSKNVQKNLNAGWVLYGYPMLGNNDSWYQALVRYETDKL